MAELDIRDGEMSDAERARFVKEKRSIAGRAILSELCDRRGLTPQSLAELAASDVARMLKEDKPTIIIEESHLIAALKQYAESINV